MVGTMRARLDTREKNMLTAFFSSSLWSDGIVIPTVGEGCSFLFSLLDAQRSDCFVSSGNHGS